MIKTLSTLLFWIAVLVWFFLFIVCGTVFLLCGIIALTVPHMSYAILGIFAGSGILFSGWLAKCEFYNGSAEQERFSFVGLK